MIATRCQAVDRVHLAHPYSERRICRALGIQRSSIRYVPEPRSDEGRLRAGIVRLSSVRALRFTVTAG